MAKSYNDPVKQKAREKLREFIRKNLLSVKKPRDVRVVCLPGAGKEGEEALEVKEVYDPLGIPRSNITGIEFDSEAAERLRKADLGISVAECDAKEFFKTNEQKFDVISLDYLGQQGIDELDTLEYIIGKQTLVNRGILATVYFGSRESKEMQRDMYIGLMLLRSIGTVHHDGTHEQGTLFDFCRKYGTEEARQAIDLTKIEVKELRDNITAATISGFMAGEFSLPNMHMICKNNIEFKRLLEFSKERLEQASKDPREYIALMRGLHSIFTHNLIQHLTKMVQLDDTAASYLLTGLQAKEANSYFADKIERYSYTSNSGSSMLMDMYQFVHLKCGYFNDLEELVSHNPDNGMITFHVRQHGALFHKKVVKVNQELEEQMRKSRYLPERIYLGSSFHPIRKERISREDAIGLLQSGCSAEEVCDCYAGFSKEQLAAFKAHITMGTYK